VLFDSLLCACSKVHSPQLIPSTASNQYTSRMSSTGTTHVTHVSHTPRPSLDDLRRTLKRIVKHAIKVSKDPRRWHQDCDDLLADRLKVVYTRLHMAAFSNSTAMDTLRRGSQSFINVENTCLTQVYRALDAQTALSGLVQTHLAKADLDLYTSTADAARVVMFQVLANFHNPDKKSVCAKVGFDYFEIGKESQCQLPSI
jgi:hypothetical protein